jgi:hypothetical protein
MKRFMFVFLLGMLALPAFSAPSQEASLPEATGDIKFTAANYPNVIVLREENFITSPNMAHPVTTVDYYNIDRQRQILITALDLPKTGINIAEATAQLRKVFKAAHPDTTLFDDGWEDGGGQPSFYIPDNFFYTPDGPGFCWQQADIAPYVAGILEVVVPIATARPYLSPDGLKLWD